MEKYTGEVLYEKNAHERIFPASVTKVMTMLLIVEDIESGKLHVFDTATFTVGGATLTKLIGTSAWYAPGAAASMMVEAILHDQKKLVPCCCYLDGEYGQKDICIGVPAIIGRKGIEKIVKIDLTKEEAEKFAASAEAVRKTNNILHEIKAL